MSIFPLKKLISIIAVLILLMFFLSVPSPSLADVKTSCSDEGKAVCKAVFGDCCDTQCCQDYLTGGSYCDSSPDCKTTPAGRCHTQCLEKNCHGYRVDVTTGECAECLDCCTPPAATMATDKACQEHCKGEYKFDTSNKCCTCTGTSFTDEMTCKTHCAEKEGKSYQYDSNTPPYCTCVDEDISTESICSEHCKPNEYKWNESAEPSQRCQCVNPGDEDSSSSSLKAPINLEVGIGGETTTKGISYYIGTVYQFATVIVGVLAAVMIIIGGIQYSASAGNPAALGSAKETITSAIIGLVIVLMSYLILGTFSGKFTNLTEPRIKRIEIGNSDRKTPIHEVCLPGEKYFGDLKTCSAYCGTRWQRNCEKRTGADKETSVYCCLEQPADEQSKFCENKCEEATHCARTLSCLAMFSDSECERMANESRAMCRMTGGSGKDCNEITKATLVLFNPHFDEAKCQTTRQRMETLCANHNCGAPTYGAMSKSGRNVMFCCTTPPASVPAN